MNGNAAFVDCELFGAIEAGIDCVLFEQHEIWHSTRPFWTRTRSGRPSPVMSAKKKSSLGLAVVAGGASAPAGRGISTGGANASPRRFAALSRHDFIELPSSHAKAGSGAGPGSPSHTALCVKAGSGKNRRRSRS